VEDRLWFILYVNPTAVYAAAALGYSRERAGKKTRGLSIPLYFCVLNIASLISLLKVLRNENIVAWQTRR
jgi:hypothetical protein